MARGEIGRTGARFGAPARRAQHAPDPERAHGHPVDEPGSPVGAHGVPADAAGADPAPDPATGRMDGRMDGEVEVGLTGARFGGRSRRARRTAGAARPAGETADPARDPGDPPGRAEPHGTSPTVAPGDGPVAAPGTAPTGDPGAGPVRAPGGGPPWAPGADGRPAPDATGPIPRTDVPANDVRTADAPALRIAARPYVLTGGRTRVRAELRIETMISATGRSGPPGPAGPESGERRAVLAVCARPRSVSEVAALVGVPLGVARVMIDDLATEGRVRVHLGVDAANGPDAALLERVLAGLRWL